MAKFSPSNPRPEVLFIGLSYALLVVNLKNLENLIFFALITLLTTCDGTRVRLSFFLDEPNDTSDHQRGFCACTKKKFASGANRE